MTTRVYLVRHAETEITEEDRYAGSRDLPLVSAGREHAEDLATRLQGFPIVAAYASPLKRAFETAEIVVGPHRLSVTPVPALREIDHGHWEGMKRQEVETTYPAEYSAYERDPFDFAPEGGETGRSVVERAAPALLEIVRANTDRTVLVVAHKATNRLLIGYFLGIGLTRYRDKIGQRAACLNVLDFESETQVKLSLLNDISHYEICAPPDEKYVV